MKKVSFSIFLLILIFPFVSKAEPMYIEITSPVMGDVVSLTKNFRIKWDSSSNIDKVGIGLKSCESCLNWIVYDMPNLGYYDWNVITGNTNTKYQIYIIGYDTGVGSVSDTSDFSLASSINDGSNNIDSNDYVESEYRIAEKYFMEDEYALGEDIVFWVQGLESDNLIATPEKGFNVQASLDKKSGSSNSNLQSVNADYDYSKNMWRITFKSPSKAGSYKTEVVLYCGNLSSSSYCGNKYGSTNYEDQAMEKYYFKVIKNEDYYDFDSQFKKYYDIKFLNPKEGQKEVEEVIAGQAYTIKWENIVKADWSDISLYKHNKKVSKDYLINGPTNVTTGTMVTKLGNAVLNQKDLIISLPNNLEPGYYYFKFSGKAAGDSSPAIKVVSEISGVKPQINNNSTDKEKLNLVLAILKASNNNGSYNQIIQILEMIITILK